MESLFILIPIAMVVVTIAVVAFCWAVKSGQYEDLDAEGKRILFDEAPQSAPQQQPSTTSSNSKSNSDKGDMEP